MIFSDTEIGEQRLFREIIDVYIYIPIVHVIPIVTLLIINILTIHRLAKYQNDHRRLLSKSIQQMATIRRSSLTHSQRHHRVTTMLIGIVSLFLLCRIPMLIDQMHKIPNSIHQHCRARRVFSICANFLQTINSNGNLIIYLLFYRNFRETSQEILGELIHFIRLSMLFTHTRSRASTHSTDT